MSTAALFDEDSSGDDEEPVVANNNKVAASNSDDSDNDENTPPPKTAPSTKKTIFDDESDVEQQPKEAVHYNEHDDDEEFDEDDGIIGTAAAEKQSVEQSSKPKPKHMTVLDAPPRPKNATVHMTRLPNIVGIQSTPFDINTYSAKGEEQDYKGFVHNMIRWRYATDQQGNYRSDEHGNIQRESNTRIVKWKDDTVTPPATYYTLHVGKNEVLELDSHDATSKINDFAGMNGYLYLSQTATMEDGTTGGTVLECVAAITSKMTARPSSLLSEAHKNLTVAVRQQTIKRAKIAEYVTQEDPEKAKEDKIRVKSDLDKVQARKKTAGGKRPGMNRRYMEDDDDGNYDSIDIKKLKKRGRDNDVESEDYGDSSEDSEEEGNYKSRLAAMKKKKAEQVDSEEDLAFGAGDDDSSDEDEQINRAKKPVKKKASVLDDDSDDDE